MQLKIKRIIDIAGSLAGLFIMLCLFPFIWAAIKIDSPGSVIFRQMRVGRGGKKFMFYKFRSMFLSITMSREDLDRLNEATGPIFKIRDDPRVTRTGRFLRNWCLDELPQFYNVLKGEMSLVGPRPPLISEVEKYSADEKMRLSMPQGMTGLWQVMRTGDLKFESMIHWDLQYVRQWNLLLDLKILAKTFSTMLRRKGAY